MNNVQIVSDGQTTNVVNIDTGKPIGLVKRITWIADADVVGCKAVIELVNVPAVLRAHAEMSDTSTDSDRLRLEVADAMMRLDDHALNLLLQVLRAMLGKAPQGNEQEEAP